MLAFRYHSRKPQPETFSLTFYLQLFQQIKSPLVAGVFCGVVLAG
jgi:hypothetical protein